MKHELFFPTGKQYELLIDFSKHSKNKLIKSTNHPIECAG